MRSSSPSSVLAALLASGGIAIALGSASGRQSALSRSEVASHSLAEAGVAEALSVLHEAENPLNPTILGNEEETTTSTYPNGSVSWWGEVDPLTGIWTITALGSQANPTSPEADTVKDRVVATAGSSPTTRPTPEPGRGTGSTRGRPGRSAT